MRATSAGGPAGVAAFVPPADAPAYGIERTRAATIAQAEQQATTVAALDQQIAQKVVEADAVAAVMAKMRAGLPMIEETAHVRERVMRMEFGNCLAHLDAHLRLTDRRKELIVQERRTIEVVAARMALESQCEQAKTEYARAVMTELAETEPKTAQCAEDLIKVDKRMQDKVMTSMSECRSVARITRRACSMLETRHST